MSRCSGVGINANAVAEYVVDVEPLPADSILRGVAGITVFSHMAGQTAEARLAAGVEGARKLVAALDGRPAYSLTQPKEPA